MNALARQSVHRDERGVALLLALMAAALVTALAASLIVPVSTETRIAGNARAAEESLYAAEAGLARTIHDLGAMPDWSAALASFSRASFDDGQLSVRAPDGRALSVATLLAERQAVSDQTDGATTFGADRPVWNPFGHGPLSAVLPPGLIAQPAYVLAFVGDDGFDGDGDSMTDSNGRLLVYVEAFGVNGSRRAVEALIAHAAPGVVRVLTWREVR
jgi:Tfp pilus assembly protein PilX